MGKARSLDIPGEDLPEVFEALQFIENFIRRRSIKFQWAARSYYWCGNTAIDAVSQSKRLGAESSTIVYRRGRKYASLHFEYDLAKKDGCEFVFNAAP